MREITKLRTVFIRSVVALLLLLGIVYAGDYGSLRFSIPKREPYGSIEVDSYYAVPLKNGKTEFDPLPSIQQTCVNSLFPHYGYPPCWYVRRHTEKRINV